MMIRADRDIRFLPLPLEDPIENALHHPAYSLSLDRTLASAELSLTSAGMSVADLDPPSVGTRPGPDASIGALWRELSA